MLLLPRFFFFTCLFCIVSQLHAQDLSNFRRLESEGEIPKDFLQLTIDKYKEDFQDNDNKALDKEFFLSSRYFIDQLLLSGRVLFNDPTTTYVQRVAKNILRREKSLFKELRFYVLKSTVANAFSTDQGIIFVTTGLLASCENEAQLAYIIAHEVSHYTEQHVQKGYLEEQAAQKGKGQYRTQEYDERISQLSVYDKQMELEADQKGIDLFLASTYSVDEIFSEFEMLLYSYLPFEDRRFDTTYLSTDLMTIPGSYFPDTIVQITLEEDYDDEGSTHPNIQKRMDAAFDYLGDKRSQGEDLYIISEEDFNQVRNLSRFENINLYLLNRQYGKAIYSIYLLERDFPDNEFLEMSFVKAWYGLTKHKNHGDFYTVAKKPKKVEGESHKLHALIRNLSKEQLNIVSLRYAVDFNKKYPNNELGKLYVADLKRELVAHSKFNFKELKSKNYDAYLSTLDDTLKTFNVEDSIKRVDNSDLSKYDKIKLKKKLRAMMDDSENSNLGESEFHLFALSDLVAEESLIDELVALKSEINSETDASLSYAEKKRIRKKGQRLGIEKIVVVDPFFENYKLKGNQDLAKSESKKLRVGDMYTKDYRRIDLEVDLVDSKKLNPSGVDAYNEIGVLYQWLTEVSEYDKDMGMICSSRDLMLDLTEKHGTSHFLFTGIQMFKDRNRFEPWHLYTIMAVYTAPIALIDLVIPHNYFTITALSVDATKDQVEFGQSETVNMRGVDLVLQAYIFDVLYQLSKKPK